MSLSIFLLWLVTILIPTLVALKDVPVGIYINCGAKEELKDGEIKWMADDNYVNMGKKAKVKTPNLLPFLSNLRYFPEDKKAQKYCYDIPVRGGGKYIVRTMYYYGGFDGGKEPPVFDQIIGGSKWSIVNTTENFSKGLTSYFEMIIANEGKILSVCLARNKFTSSSPFISAIEVMPLEDSMYNTTDMTKYALFTIARHRFGSKEQILRYWEAFEDKDYPVVETHTNVTSSDFWNLPPPKAFWSALTTSRGKTLKLKWPPMPLPRGTYYIFLYFQDNRNPSPYSWRVFSITVNAKTFYNGLNVTTAGVTVFGDMWPLSGPTEILLIPNASSPVGPVINAGEILQVFPLGGKTAFRDLVAMQEFAKSLTSRPSDWSGDPCRPILTSWTGVSCSRGKIARVLSLNLTGGGYTGSLSASLAKLTALTDISLGGNKLKGPIPDLSPLTNLITLHLDSNELSGKIPTTLEKLRSLKELYLQNNKFEGDIPAGLKSKQGLTIKY